MAIQSVTLTMMEKNNRLFLGGARRAGAKRKPAESAILGQLTFAIQCR